MVFSTEKYKNFLGRGTATLPDHTPPLAAPAVTQLKFPTQTLLDTIRAKVAPDASTAELLAGSSQLDPAMRPAELEIAVGKLLIETDDADIETDEEQTATTRRKKRKSVQRDNPAKYPAPDEPDVSPGIYAVATTGIRRKPSLEPSASDEACIRKPCRPAKPACRQIRKWMAPPVIALPTPPTTTSPVK